MPGDADARVIANAQRQAELMARGRDLTKPQPPAGSDGDSLRRVHGMENITDEMLAHQATFTLREHLAGQRAVVPSGTLDLTQMSEEELAGLEKAAKQQRKAKEKR